eukprot:ANDGO_06709.mRNA.1 Transcription factor TFIIIB component B''
MSAIAKALSAGKKASAVSSGGLKPSTPSSPAVTNPAFRPTIAGSSSTSGINNSGSGVFPSGSQRSDHSDALGSTQRTSQHTGSLQSRQPGTELNADHNVSQVFPSGVLVETQHQTLGSSASAAPGTVVQSQPMRSGAGVGLTSRAEGQFRPNVPSGGALDSLDAANAQAAHRRRISRHVEDPSRSLHADHHTTAAAPQAIQHDPSQRGYEQQAIEGSNGITSSGNRDHHHNGHEEDDDNISVSSNAVNKQRSSALSRKRMLDPTTATLFDFATTVTEGELTAAERKRREAKRLRIKDRATGRNLGAGAVPGGLGEGDAGGAGGVGNEDDDDNNDDDDHDDDHGSVSGLRGSDRGGLGGSLSAAAGSSSLVGGNTGGSASATSMPTFPQPVFGPQLKIVNGKLVLDESSLVIRTEANQLDESVLERVEETRRRITSATFLRHKPGPRWSADETERFYRMLSMFGTDFTILQRLFPNRTRRQIKSKFTREDKMNPGRLDDALRTPIPAGEEELRMLEESLRAHASHSVRSSDPANGAAGPSARDTAEEEEDGDEEEDGEEEEEEVGDSAGGSGGRQPGPGLGLRPSAIENTSNGSRNARGNGNEYDEDIPQVR